MLHPSHYILYVGVIPDPNLNSCQDSLFQIKHASELLKKLNKLNKRGNIGMGSFDDIVVSRAIRLAVFLVKDKRVVEVWVKPKWTQTWYQYKNRESMTLKELKHSAKGSRAIVVQFF